ncbi:glycosyltransferase family 2 protein [Stenotrophomonas geniculata]|uniref:Glycosyl transferase n=1 Tax=Stenotrophomonas geniculata N1 TaxID=1167641 RepID=A0A0L8ABI2_9GAMM|nr:glycosyltransferase family A protein [Stenotrophomonas geniculata]KOE99753.1 glycosyl transferase [Stenotrophomonas geniculata N1]MCI1112889.1 glycosyltransferase family 2 protein [Stenotrophomonas maltophilia]
MTPRLTIGLIIYNGVDIARRCIDSLISQTYTDFVLLIHDNGSTDGTSEICAEYAARDLRVRHVRHPQTIPQSDNFRGVLMSADSEYYMWAADDDIWSPQFAELCIAQLDANPDAVACCTEVNFRYPDGDVRRARGTFPIVGTPDERVRTYLHNPRDSARLYGVYRTKALQASYPAGLNMFGYDWLVVCLSMLHGHHLQVDGVQLLRSGHAPGKYFERYDRHFVRDTGLIGRLSWFLPLLPLSQALKAHLPRSAWRASRLRVARLNLIQLLLLLKWKWPVLNNTFLLARKIDLLFSKKQP